MATQSAVSVSEAEVFAANDETVVFESVRHIKSSDVKEAGDVVEVIDIVDETGAVDDALFQRYARPFAFTNESSRFHFAAWRMPLDDGGREEGVRVTTAESGPAQATSSGLDKWIHPELLGEVVSDSPLRVLLRIQGFPDWDVPILPDALFVDTQSFADAVDAQESAMLAREALMEAMAADLTAMIEDAGGSVLERHWVTGWMDTEIPGGALAGVLDHPEVLTAVPVGAYGGGTAAGRSDLRPTTVMGVDRYWSASQFGDKPNPERHGFGAIAVATIDTGPVKDEASAFCTDASCNSTKFAKRYRCDMPTPPYCATVTDYPAWMEHYDTDATNHSTIVAATVVGDYMDNQPMGGTFDRPAATAEAREARLIHFGPLGGFHFPGNAGLSYASAITNATFDQADIITSGTFLTEGGGGGTCISPSSCDLPAVLQHEMAAEVAFDSGAFLAITPSNSCGPFQSTCSVASPAQIPKVFTVNGLMGFPGCASDYRTCQLDALPDCGDGNPCGNSARGGADARVGVATVAHAVSVIDLAVPQNVTHLTQCCPWGGLTCFNDGYIDQIGGDSGTSYANPRAAGLAALAKDYFLDTRQSWFNAPGWLHTYMLGQGDAHRSSNPQNPVVATTRTSTGADRYYGMGRVKMRHPDAFGLYGHDFRSVTFTNVNPYQYFVGNVPLASSTQILKCVLAQHEDMSHKGDIGWLKLEAWLRPPIDGRCSFTAGSAGYLADLSYDTKKMVAFRASAGQVGGMCAHVRVTPNVLPSNGSVWTQLFCYAADEEDDEPN